MSRSHKIDGFISPSKAMNTAPPPVLTARPSSRLAIVRLALLGAALLPQSAHASLFHGETLDAAARISTPSAAERDRRHPSRSKQRAPARFRCFVGGYGL